jgi:hypothetical protein
MMRTLLRHFTYANTMASLAILMAFGGTAYAALMITGKNVRNNSLTGVDVRNSSLTRADLSASTRRAFTGAKGTNGKNGTNGNTGATGPKGEKGDPGAAAEVVTSYASRDTGFIVRNNLAPPNPHSAAWYDYNCGGVNSDAAGCGTDDGNQSNAGVGQIELIPAGIMVLALQGMSKDGLETQHTFTTTNNVAVPWSNNLTGMASISLLHTGTLHERAECSLQYANSATPSTFNDLGQPQLVSAFGHKEIVSQTIVGSKNVPAGTYNVRVVCSDMDTTGAASWRFIRGNLTAMAARNG